MPRALALAFAILVAAASARAETPGPAPRPADELFWLDYRFGVAIECGLVDDRALLGYLCAARAAAIRYGFDEPQRRKILSRAMIAVEREWSNRGLGGYRNWCRNEGMEAQRLFQGFACQADSQPP